MNPSKPAPVSDASRWDQRYCEGGDGWELGQPAPPLARFLLEDLGFSTIGLDFSGEALGEARRLHGQTRPTLQWLQADLFDRQALEAAGLTPGSLSGIVEHTCFCAIDPGLREDHLATAARLLAQGGPPPSP